MTAILFAKLSSVQGSIKITHAPETLVKEIQQVLAQLLLYDDKVDGIAGKTVTSYQ